VVPVPDGAWILSMSDFAGSVSFPDWVAHALREWDVVCPEGSDDLFELCRTMGWQEHQLQVWKGRHRELVEVVGTLCSREAMPRGSLSRIGVWMAGSRRSCGRTSARELAHPGSVPTGLQDAVWLRRSLAGLGRARRSIALRKSASARSEGGPGAHSRLRGPDLAPSAYRTRTPRSLDDPPLRLHPRIPPSETVPGRDCHFR
jgi:hypothetical protein